MEIVVPGKTDLVSGTQGLYSSRDVLLADHLLDLKKKNRYNPWPVVDAVLGAWAKRNPEEYKSTILTIEEERGTRANAWGSNGDGLRFTLDVPFWVEAVLRRVYSTDELPFDKGWYKEFWKRYPRFRVSENI